MMYIIGICAIIFLHKIFEERGYKWGFMFCLLLLGIFGFINNMFIPMFQDGLIEFITQILLMIFVVFIYSKIMYLIFNNTGGWIIFSLSAAAASVLCQYGMLKIYPMILEFVLRIIMNYI